MSHQNASKMIGQEREQQRSKKCRPTALRPSRHQDAGQEKAQQRPDQENKKIRPAEVTIPFIINI